MIVHQNQQYHLFTTRGSLNILTLRSGSVSMKFSANTRAPLIRLPLSLAQTWLRPKNDALQMC